MGAVGVNETVVARAAGQHIAARGPIDAVSTSAAIQRVRHFAARQPVTKSTANQHFDRRKPISGGIPSNATSCAKTNRYGLTAEFITCRISSRIAKQLVCTRPPYQGIIPIAASDPVAACTTP